MEARLEGRNPSISAVLEGLEVVCGLPSCAHAPARMRVREQPDLSFQSFQTLNSLSLFNKKTAENRQLDAVQTGTIRKDL